MPVTFLAAVPSAGSLPVDGGEFPEEAEESERKVPTAPPPRTLLAFTKFNMLEPTSLPFPSFPPTHPPLSPIHSPTHLPVHLSDLPYFHLTHSPSLRHLPNHPSIRVTDRLRPPIHQSAQSSGLPPAPPVPHPVIPVSTLSPFPHSSKCPSISSASIQRMFLGHRRRNTRPFLGDQERLPGGRPPKQRHEECTGGI